MTQPPEETLNTVVDRLLATPPGPGWRLLCVDGPSGSGKTTLAAALVAALPAELSRHLLRMDDLYEGWSGLGEVDRRIREKICVPLAAGEPGWYRRYDWERETFAELHVVPPVDVLVLEGVGSGSSLLARYRSLLVWVEAPRELRMRRGLERDGAAFAPHWERWAESEAAHFAAHGTRAAADLRVDAYGRLV